MIVVDASVVVTALVDDGADGALVRDRLRGERLAAPELLDLEVTSALRSLVARGDVTAERAEQALGDLVELRCDRSPHAPLLGRCWELRDVLTVYDAAYVALAEALGVALLTADGRLARAPGVGCPVELLVG